MSWRDDFDPNDALSKWEPVPWDLDEEDKIQSQWEGWRDRMAWSLKWDKVSSSDLMELGLSQKQINEAEVELISHGQGEVLLLINRLWFGFPDPPQFGLISKKKNNPDSRWLRWGSFWDPPDVWALPEDIIPKNLPRVGLEK